MWRQAACGAFQVGVDRLKPDASAVHSKRGAYEEHRGDDPPLRSLFLTPAEAVLALRTSNKTSNFRREGAKNAEKTEF